MSEDFQRPLGDYLGECLREVSWNFREVSWNLEICENGREILQKCRWTFINAKMKVGTATALGSLEIQECLGDEIFQQRRCYLKTTPYISKVGNMGNIITWGGIHRI